MEQEIDSEAPSLFASTFDSPGADAPVVAEAGQPEAAPEPTPEEKGDTAPEAEAGQPRDEAGRFAPKPKDAETAAPPAAEREPPNVPVAALKDERSKRQAAEAELAQMRAFIAQMQQQAQRPAPQQPAEKPDPIGALLDDPGQFVGHHVQQALAPVQEAMMQQRIALSRQFVASQAADYAEAEALMDQHVAAAAPQVKDHVAKILRSHPNPAQWVLEQGRRLKELSEFEQWRASRNQPAPVEQPAPSAPANPLPASLATARGVGASRQPDDSEPRSLIQGTWRS